ADGVAEVGGLVAEGGPPPVDRALHLPGPGGLRPVDGAALEEAGLADAVEGGELARRRVAEVGGLVAEGGPPPVDGALHLPGPGGLRPVDGAALEEVGPAGAVRGAQLAGRRVAQVRPLVAQRRPGAED